jgi:hypothetical protein
VVKPTRKRRREFRRFLSCGNCAREIVVVKGAWACPHCGHDNRPCDFRPGNHRADDTGEAMTRRMGDLMEEAGGFRVAQEQQRRELD